MPTLTTVTSNYRKWSYKTDGLVLEFTLNVDSKHEIVNFLSLLVRATSDLEEELIKFNKK